jgi:hypothetical protein
MQLYQYLPLLWLLLITDMRPDFATAAPAQAVQFSFCCFKQLWHNTSMCVALSADACVALLWYAHCLLLGGWVILRVLRRKQAGLAVCQLQSQPRTPCRGELSFQAWWAHGWSMVAGDLHGRWWASRLVHCLFFN